MEGGSNLENIIFTFIFSCCCFLRCGIEHWIRWESPVALSICISTKWNPIWTSICNDVFAQWFPFGRRFVFHLTKTLVGILFKAKIDSGSENNGIKEVNIRRRWSWWWNIKELHIQYTRIDRFLNLFATFLQNAFPFCGFFCLNMLMLSIEYSGLGPFFRQANHFQVQTGYSLNHSSALIIAILLNFKLGRLKTCCKYDELNKNV